MIGYPVWGGLFVLIFGCEDFGFFGFASSSFLLEVNRARGRERESVCVLS